MITNVTYLGTLTILKGVCVDESFGVGATAMRYRLCVRLRTTPESADSGEQFYH